MMRTSATDVKQIIETTLTDLEIEAYITGANEVVTQVVGSDTSISATLKQELERWLTAHMIASTREQQLSKSKAGPAEGTYQGKTGLGLDSTMYGQTVKVLDTTGKFAALGGKGAFMWAIKE